MLRPHQRRKLLTEHPGYEVTQGPDLWISNGRKVIAFKLRGYRRRMPRQMIILQLLAKWIPVYEVDFRTGNVTRIQRPRQVLRRLKKRRTK